MMNNNPNKVGQLAQHGVRVLERMPHVCSFCKRVNVEGRWTPIEQFIRERADITFSHGLCPECAEKHYSDLFRGGKGEVEKESSTSSL